MMNCRGGFRGEGIDFVANQPHFREAKSKEIEKGCEYYCRNKGKLSGQSETILK